MRSACHIEPAAYAHLGLHWEFLGIQVLLATLIHLKRFPPKEQSCFAQFIFTSCEDWLVIVEMFGLLYKI